MIARPLSWVHLTDDKGQITTAPVIKFSQFRAGFLVQATPLGFQLLKILLFQFCATKNRKEERKISEY